MQLHYVAFSVAVLGQLTLMLQPALY